VKQFRAAGAQTRATTMALDVGNMAESSSPINLLCSTEGDPFYTDKNPTPDT